MGTEVFNASQVKSVISDVEAQFSDLANIIEKSNNAITAALGSPDKAVYGDAGNKILATWDENCSTLNEFIKIFDNWSLMVTSIAKEYGELDSGTAKVDNVDLSSFKAISGANKTTYLSTDSAKSKYEGSKSEYYDFNENAKYVETNDLNKRRVVTKTSQGNNSTIDYEDMAGNKLNVSSVDSSGRAITKEEAAQLEKVKEAQKALQSSIKTKHDELAKRDKERKEAAAASEWAIGPYDSILHMNQHEANSGYNERQKRIAFLGGMKSSDSAQRAMMTNIQVPVWDGTKETTITLFVNKKLVNNYQKAFREVCNLKFPIRVNPSQSANCAYAWNHWRPGGERSDHAYGGTFDINTNDNWGRGKNNQYSLRNRPDVVKAFEKQGFFWGGNWEGEEDDMHFSFTGY